MLEHGTPGHVAGVDISLGGFKLAFKKSIQVDYAYWGVFPKKNGKTPKSSILIGFSLIFTIHFGGPPLFLETSVCFQMVWWRPSN